MISILLADDHHLVRKGIMALLEKFNDLTIVGEAENGQAAVELSMRLKPNVVVMDINMPILNGIQATDQIVRLNPGAHVVILSMYSDDTLVRQALLAGAQGYVLKGSITDELVLAIRSAHRNETFLSPKVSKVLLENLKEFERRSTEFDPLQQLTSRERQVMQLIAEGYTTKSIATMLSISDKTVEKHRTNLMNKLGVHDIAGIVRMAIKHGLIFIDE